MYLLVVPPFEPPDELAHLQYARFVATTGTLPNVVPPHGAEWRPSSYEFVQQPLYYLGAAAILKATGLDAAAPDVTLNPRSRMRAGGTEPTIFQHSADAEADRPSRRLHAASRLGVDGAGDDVPHRQACAHRHHRPPDRCHDHGRTGLIPQWCAVMTAVSTDPPATLLASAATLAIVRIALGRTGKHGALLAGLLIGAAYAVKATAVFLAPMALLACVLGQSRAPRQHDALVRSARPRAEGVRAAAAAIGPGVVLAAAWIHLRAWLMFGDPTARAFKKAILEAGGFAPTAGPMPWTPEFWTQMRVIVLEPFWARFGSLGAGPFLGVACGCRTRPLLCGW